MGVEVTISKKVDIKSLSLEERLNLAHSSKDDKIHKALAVDEASEVKVALLNRLNLSEDAIDILFNDKDEKVVSALKEYFRNEIRKGTYLYDLVNVYTFSKIVFDKPLSANEKYDEEQILALISFMFICNQYLGATFDRSTQYFCDDEPTYWFFLEDDCIVHSYELEKSIKRFAMMYALVANEVSAKLKTTYYWRTSKFENLMGLLLLHKPEKVSINRWLINVATVTYLCRVNCYSDKKRIPERYQNACEAFDEAYDFFENESFKKLID